MLCCSTGVAPFILEVNRRPKIEAIVLLYCCPVAEIEELHTCLWTSESDGSGTKVEHTHTPEASACLR